MTLKGLCGAGVVVLGMLVAACTKANPAARCASDGVCTDPSFPYCDVDGSVSGEPNTCVAINCTAGEFKSCSGSNAETLCNAAGNGTTRSHCGWMRSEQRLRGVDLHRRHGVAVRRR